jgi:hypothetical protein
LGRARTLAVSALFRASMSARKVSSVGVGDGREALSVIAFATDCTNGMRL